MNNLSLSPPLVGNPPIEPYKIETLEIAISIFFKLLDLACMMLYKIAKMIIIATSTFPLALELNAI